MDNEAFVTWTVAITDKVKDIDTLTKVVTHLTEALSLQQDTIERLEAKIARQEKQIAYLYDSIERFKDRMDEDYDYFHTYLAR